MNITLEKVAQYIKNPRRILSYIINVTPFFWKHVDDKTFLKIIYWVAFGKKLNLDNPTTFNEKLQWLKLYNRKPEYTIMVDKVKAKEYVASIIGEEHIIPTLGVWERPEDIDFDALPNQFVLKCNHNSGGLFICKDKSKVTPEKWEQVKAGLRKSLKQDYYLYGREWPYKDVPRRILAEKFMVDESGTELTDFKTMVFGGRVHCTFTCTERFSDGVKVTFYDRDWKRMPFTRHYPNSSTDIEKPKAYDEMIRLAETLGADLTFARIDFYEIEGHLYFGEITFFPGCGMEEFNPEEWDERLGKLIKLPNRGGVFD